ncbi:MAG: nucleoside monophosphate kinase [Acidimicrobiales bacterium]
MKTSTDSPRAARPRRVVVLARPGGGKSTQAARLARRLGVDHLSSGAMIRDEVASSSGLGRTVAPLVERGELVPDELVLAVIVPALRKAVADHGGYVLDGFPRDVAQATTLAGLGSLALGPELALWLDVGADECRRRLLGRAGLEGRSDDTARTVERRLAAYEQETAPVLTYYEGGGDAIVVDGVGAPEDVEDRVADALGVA